MGDKVAGVAFQNLSCLPICAHHQYISISDSGCLFILIQVIGADLALLDEIDSGLDVDALEDVANAVNGLLTPQNSVLMITHYQRLLDLIKPSYVHIMVSRNMFVQMSNKYRFTLVVYPMFPHPMEVCILVYMPYGNEYYIHFSMNITLFTLKS